MSSSSIDYIKHLIQCKCVLPQFTQTHPTVWHSFVAFSEIDQSGNVIPSFAQCNNCGVIHKVTEIGNSVVLKKEEMQSLPTSEELLAVLPEKLVALLKNYECNLVNLQEIVWVFEHEAWGRHVILNKEIIEGMMVGKYIQILGTSLWKINKFQEEYNDTIK